MEKVAAKLTVEQVDMRRLCGRLALVEECVLNSFALKLQKRYEIRAGKHPEALAALNWVEM